MIDWTGRIDELMDHLAHEWGITDRLAVEIALASYVECPHTPRAWIAVEEEIFTDGRESSWIGFGGLWNPIGLLIKRRRYPFRKSQEKIEYLLNHTQEAQIFIEPDYEQFPVIPQVMSRSPELMMRMLRVRVPHPLTHHCLRAVDRRCQERRWSALLSRAMCVVEDRAGARPDRPPVFRMPTDFLYYAELLYRLSSFYKDWDVLVVSLAALAIRHAYLTGKEQTDVAALNRVMRDMVQVWTTRLLRKLEGGKSRGCNEMVREMALESSNKTVGMMAHRVIWRLNRRGILDHPVGGKYYITEEHREPIRHLLDGEAFDSL